MFGQTRAGYCVAALAPGDAVDFISGLPVSRDLDVTFYGDSCASVNGYGSPKGAHQFDLLPGAARYLVNGTLPSNTENVRLRAVVMNPSGDELCFEYEFPYG